MLSQYEFDLWCIRLKIPELTRKSIESIRTSEPTHRVESGIFHKIVNFTSEKMERTIQAGSSTVAFPHLLQMEVDKDILEIYDEPPKFKITFNTTTKKGKIVKTSPWYTADYFIITTTGFGWIETKTEKELLKHIKTTDKFMQDENGIWRCPSAGAYAEKLGGFFRVYTEDGINPILYRNIRFQLDYLSIKFPRTQLEIVDKILSWVRDNPGITLKKLFDQFVGIDRKNIFKMIADQQIYVDIYNDPLAEPTKVRVFDDIVTAKTVSVLEGKSQQSEKEYTNYIDYEVGTNFLLGEIECTLIENTDDYIVGLDKDGNAKKILKNGLAILLEKGVVKGIRINQHSSPEVFEIYTHASPKDKARALHRWELVCAKRTGKTLPYHTESDKTIRRYEIKVCNAEKKFGNGFLGCFDDNKHKGSHLEKANATSKSMILTSHKKHHIDDRVTNMNAEYQLYVDDCNKVSVQPVSKPTYKKEIKKIPKFEDEMALNGHKSANQFSKPYRGKGASMILRDGDRPFETLRIDHTKSIEYVCPRTGINLGVGYDSWITDPKTKRILVALSGLSQPNGDTNLLLMRLLVKRFGMLPLFVGFDGGSDFGDKNFLKLLTTYNVSPIPSKKSASKDNAFHERMFQTSQKQFTDLLRGSIKFREEHYRQITPKNDPVILSCWPLVNYYECLTDYCYEIHDKNPNPALFGLSPFEAHNIGIAEAGTRENRKVEYDDQFIFDTLPAPGNGKAKVRPGYGVKINYLYYWCDDFANADIENKSLDVLYDPITAGLGYAFISTDGRTGVWKPCKSEKFDFFSQFHPREIIALASEMRQQLNLGNQGYSITANSMINFWNDIKDKEHKLIELRLQNLSYKDVLTEAKLYLPSSGGNIIQNLPSDEQSTSSEHDSNSKPPIFSRNTDLD